MTFLSPEIVKHLFHSLDCVMNLRNLLFGSLLIHSDSLLYYSTIKILSTSFLEWSRKMIVACSILKKELHKKNWDTRQNILKIKEEENIWKKLIPGGMLTTVVQCNWLTECGVALWSPVVGWSLWGISEILTLDSSK